MTKVKQAEHNEKACLYLNKSGQFPDWVITTAFYSAIHYIDGCLFPGQFEIANGKVKNCTSIDDYCSKCRQFTDGSKHEMRLILVEDNCINIAPAFKWLSDQSSLARYSNYNTSQGEKNFVY